MWIILKLKNSVITDPKNWDNICQIITQHLDDGLHPVLVCSASKDVINKFLKTVRIDIEICDAKKLPSEKNTKTILIVSDTPDVLAANLAVKLKATRCEIWANIPGIYTANPKLIPEARLLNLLDYDEAQEIVSMGDAIMQPSCLPPLKLANIPLHIKFIQDPKRSGTIISQEKDKSGLQIKSILTKKGVILISIETVNMWHQVGFLANIFNTFKKHDVSIDLISTSEATVTVSIDNETIQQKSDVIDLLLTDLNEFANAKVIGPCASISIVGHNIRGILHQLGSVFELFASQQIYLLSQAANDLNLTFVIDENQAERTARQLHSQLIDKNPLSRHLSSSWQEEFGEVFERKTPWWELKKDQLLKLSREKSPRYVYDQETIGDAISQLKSCSAIDQVFYAIKANSNPKILLHIAKHGVNFECVSIEEIELILSLLPKFSSKRILFTPNFASQEEYQKALKLGVHVTIDSLYPLQHWPNIFKDQKIILRIDPGQGSGHHKFVVTGGDASKFGIPLEDLDNVKKISAQNNIQVVGLHIHSGSGIFQIEHWERNAKLLLGLLGKFPDVKTLNLGGGLGVEEYPGQEAFNVSNLNNALAKIKTSHPNIKLWIEPGRFVVAKAGVLLARVTQVKAKRNSYFIGIETGMNSLIRPALYGAYHEIVNLTRLNEPRKVIANVVGPICESGDTLGYSRFLPETKEGDIILIANTGAYGYTMSSSYNQRQPAEEYYLADNN